MASPTSNVQGTLLRALLGLSLFLTVAGTPRAQPDDDIDLPRWGPDITTLSDAEGLDLILQAGLPWPDAVRVLQRVAASGDSTLRPALREIAEMFAGEYSSVAYNALYALEALGEPDAYFLENAQRYTESVKLARYSILILAQEPDSTTLALLEPLREASGDGRIQGAVSEYEAVMSNRAHDDQLVTVDSLIDDQLRGISSAIPFDPDPWAYQFDREALAEYDYRGGIGPSDVYARRRLAGLAAQYPTLVREAIANNPPSWDFLQDIPPDLLAQQIADFRAYADSVVFEVDVPTQPPANPNADVPPILECVEADDEGSYIAFFGYDNRYGQPVTIPYGASNQVTPTPYDRQQPEVYLMPTVVPDRPGRTSLYPGYAWRVRFQAGEEVTWTLGDYITVGATDDPALRCGTYDPETPDLLELPAAVTVAAEPLMASFTGNSFVISGFDHDLNGSTTGSGEDRHGIATADEASRQSILDELSSNQEGNVTGQSPAPDVAVTLPGLEVEALVNLLLSRSGVIILEADPGNQTIGSTSAPAVAYAPEGLDAKGNFEGFGILVVDGTFEDTVELRGNASWAGLVIVRGQSGAEAQFDMSGSVQIVGAVVLHSEAGAVFDLGGSSSVLWSREALDLAQTLLDSP